MNKFFQEIFFAKPAEASILNSVGGWLVNKSVEKFTKYAEDNTFEGLKKKAQNGDIESQFKLGEMYFTGDSEKNVTQNYSEALRWFSAAAEKNYAPAQYYLGIMYYEDKGVLQDFEKNNVC